MGPSSSKRRFTKLIHHRRRVLRRRPNRKERKRFDRESARSLGITVSEWNRMDKVC